MTIQAAMNGRVRNDDATKDLQVIDLGEAGRQEVWQQGSCCITKTIVKHGGTYIFLLPRADDSLTAPRRADGLLRVKSEDVQEVCGLLRPMTMQRVPAQLSRTEHIRTCVKVDALNTARVMTATSAPLIRN